MPRKKTKAQEQKEQNMTVENKHAFASDYTQEMLNMMNSNLMYHPLLQSQILKDINMNPMYQDYETVETLISDPKNHEKELRELAQYLNNTTMAIKRLIDYYTKILT